ncbi:alkanesulfonate monooxygenase SsuD/methylene tetrahydromethanopterin reductase-like flavin-dependent oxidoreductase (luciferase family) [Nocardia transvalensis]|uniref:Alkanesulfonate monooxygenase SsuD/methylene tetrahydromethanopterin reductase-like flavin-dependent oxidoreductase (Luciferase family) n=1 Tax=Nocardia transvalensis TaxID=37333 RepID=A0A7W9PI71_9NOCA|nr:LLM class flavin-dependent oxidoreductase [Nocardia transvalensis]MBB5916527.1 alkanesulfonate monooxygenase SsuD/methylene tetrahydromethanopterin reductase-like flavin-dependent oxidoreductase (luciferase family) [Nocardia transvalensis]
MAPNPLHLGVALDGAGWHPAAWREPGSRPADLFGPAYWTDLVAVAERGLLDFVTIEDSLAVPGARHEAGEDRVDRVRARLDAHLIAARVAPVTRHIGLVPTVTTTHTEPFHVSAALATLDYTSRGRAGWQARVSATAAEAAHFGRRELRELTAAELAEAVASGVFPDTVRDLFAEAADFTEVVRRLWDSWEDDAEIRDVATRRFIDRGKLHYIDFESRFFAVRGPSITPRPPQGQPVVTALAHAPLIYEFAARSADLVFVTPTRAAGPRPILDQVAAAATAVGRAGEPLRVYADIVVFLDTPAATGPQRLARLNEAAGAEFRSDAGIFAGSADELADLLAEWSGQGVDGFRLRPGVAVDDLTAVTERLVPALQRRGLFRTGYPGGSLRALLGLPGTVPNRYATA